MRIEFVNADNCFHAGDSGNRDDCDDRDECHRMSGIEGLREETEERVNQPVGLGDLKFDYWKNRAMGSAHTPHLFANT